MTHATTTHPWCGIEFTAKEWEDSINGKISLRHTINNILESGLPLLEDLRAGKTLTTDQNKLMKRIEQIIVAAQAHGVVLAECNEQLLEAFDYLAK